MLNRKTSAFQKFNEQWQNYWKKRCGVMENIQKKQRDRKRRMSVR